MTDRGQLEALVRSAATALQAGDYAGARRLLDQVTAVARGNIQIWLMQAIAARGMADWVAAEAAADRALTADPQNIRALIVKGDARAALDEPRGATRFYDSAIKLADGRSLPGDLANEVARARDASQTLAAAFRQQLETGLAAADIPRSRRFQHALDLLFGEKQIYQQQPKMFYFPELPQRQYFEREEFDWVPALEAQTDAIRDELLRLLADRSGFRPYLVSDPNSPRKEFHGLNDNPDWSSLYLHENGAPVAANVARAPVTYAAMRDLPLCRITTRAPTIMFSLLKAGARIPAHTGMLNTRLICHLPLVVPPDCGFRVGNEVREWEVGKLLIFDDTMEHEAWNDSDEDRVVLIFDVWRPEITPDERTAVEAIFAQIDSGQT